MSYFISLTLNEQPDSRFMIDYQTYSKMHPSAEVFDFEIAEKLSFDARPSYLDLDTNGNADLYCLMAPGTYGFCLTENKWSKCS